MGAYEVEERQAIVTGILATPLWQEDAHGCLLTLSSALACKAGDEWLAVERWLKGHGNGEA